MAEFTVPDRDRDAIARILNLQPDDAAQLLERLTECGTSSAAMIDVLDQVVGDGSHALRALVNFAVFPRRFGIPIDEVEPIIKKSFGAPDSIFPLAKLMSLKALTQFAKALDLRNVYENILHTSRILTDIRPVFDDDEIEDEVEAAMVNHILQLKYRTGEGDSRELHLAVDATDLRALQKQIDRALKKEQAGNSFIKRANATVLEPLETGES